MPVETWSLSELALFFMRMDVAGAHEIHVDAGTTADDAAADVDELVYRKGIVCRNVVSKDALRQFVVQHVAFDIESGHCKRLTAAVENERLRLFKFY